MWFITDSLPHEIFREQYRLDNFPVHISCGGPLLLLNYVRPFLDLRRKIFFPLFAIQTIQFEG